MTRSLISVYIFLSLLTLPGCETFSDRLKSNLNRANKNVNYFLDQAAKPLVRRVLVMNVIDSTFKPDNAVIAKVYDKVVFAISSKNYFEVIKYTEFDEKIIEEIDKHFIKGPSEKVDVKQVKLIKDLTEKYKIDAILYPEIRTYRPYSPMVFGYKHYMVSTLSGENIWVVDDVLNMAEKNVNALAKNWYYKHHDDSINPSLHGKIMDISFDNFLSFSLDVFFESWVKIN